MCLSFTIKLSENNNEVTFPSAASYDSFSIKDNTNDDINHASTNETSSIIEQKTGRILFHDNLIKKTFFRTRFV